MKNSSWKKKYFCVRNDNYIYPLTIIKRNSNLLITHSWFMYKSHKIQHGEIISAVGWGTAGILQSTPPDWELQDRKWHLNSSVHKQKCLTLTMPALASWRPKNDVTMMCADLWRGYQRGLIIHYDAHARRFRKAQVISSSADLRWTHIGPRQEGLRGKVCEKVYHDKFINGRRDF